MSEKLTFRDVFENKYKDRWDRSIDCSNNNLTSLEGAPSYVGVNFYCDVNQLTSLEGAPLYVGGSFYCRMNNLTSLEGAPISVRPSTTVLQCIMLLISPLISLDFL
jgi:hypothetical protein